MALEYYPLSTVDNNLLTINNEHIYTWRHDALEPILMSLRSDLEGKQRKKCFFCKTHMSKDNMIEDMEHILYKNAYLQFTYEPKNLILACRACNFAKGTKDIGINLNYLKDSIYVTDYPLTSHSYSIIHPYIDNYDNHIHVELNFIFVGLDEKGDETIKAYKLYREKLIIEKAEHFFSNQNELQSSLNSLRFDYNSGDILDSITTLESEIDLLIFDD